MNSTIPAELENFVREQVESGRYESPEEVVHAGIVLLQERERQRDRLRADIDTAIEQIENGDHVEYDSDSLRDFFDELKKAAISTSCA